jgi:hypothetical protein
MMVVASVEHDVPDKFGRSLNNSAVGTSHSAFITQAAQDYAQHFYKHSISLLVIILLSDHQLFNLLFYPACFEVS